VFGGQYTGASPGIDCSQFIQEVLAVVGLDPAGDQTAQMLFNELSKTCPLVLSQTQLGDVIFYGQDTNRITHISMAISKDHIIEAGGGGRESTNIANSRGYVRIRPKFNRRDVVATLRLPIEFV
jgi:cell wall-associated NlpC family hydrolase